MNLVPSHPCPWINTSQSRASHVVSLEHGVRWIRVPTQRDPNCPLLSHFQCLGIAQKPCFQHVQAISSPPALVYQRPKCPRLSVEAYYLTVHLARKIKGMEITDKKISEIWIFLVRLSSFLAIREHAIVFATGNVRKRKLDYLLNFAIFAMLSSIMMEVEQSSHAACQEQ